MYPSISENNGIATLTDKDLHIYSVGISTGGLAEMRMADLNPERRIIATTIDTEGARFARKTIEEKRFSKQITVKIEDVSKPLPYSNKSFDFIYARLILHYLPKNELTNSLNELYRILKTAGKLFTVVRSSLCHEANSKNSTHDPLTGMTTYVSDNGASFSRYFHTKDSIQKHLAASGFTIEHIKSYEEQLCVDFQRTQPSSHIDSLIEVLVSK